MNIPIIILDSGVFWEIDKLYNVNIGNLINGLKKHYGYVVDSLYNQENDPSGVLRGKLFIKEKYSDLHDILDKNGVETPIILERFGPNSFSIKPKS